MPQDYLDFLDFDLLLERAVRGFRAHVLNSPVGQAESEFKMPFSEMELEVFFLRMSQSRGLTRRAEKKDSGPTRELGGKLFEAVFTEDVLSVCVVALTRRTGKAKASAFGCDSRAHRNWPICRGNIFTIRNKKSLSPSREALRSCAISNYRNASNPWR